VLLRRTMALNCRSRCPEIRLWRPSRPQRACAIQDLVVQRILLHDAWGNVVQVLARRKNLIAEFLHMAGFFAQQLGRIAIGIGCGCYGSQAEALSALRTVIRHPGVRHRLAILNGIQEYASPFPDVTHGFYGGIQEIFGEPSICRLIRLRNPAGTRGRQGQYDLTSVISKGTVH
jgi:hypothetical protein